MKLDPHKAQFRFVCFHCRKMLKKILLRSRYPWGEDKANALHCAECGSALTFVGRYFKPPRREDLKAWKQLAFLPNPVIEKQKQQEQIQQVLHSAKEQQRQMRLWKRQKRPASRSRPGRTLTSRAETTEANWPSLGQRI